MRFSHPGNVVMFGTCAQVNTFQAPATVSNAMIGEFYMINDQETTVHFRDGSKAMVVCLEGGMRELEMDPSTRDTKLPSANIEQFPTVGSKKYLAEEGEQ